MEGLWNMSDVLGVSKSMKGCIDKLDVLIKLIRPYNNKLALHKVAYEKAIAKTIIGLKNGMEYTMGDGFPVINPPTTIVEKIAKGLCWREKLKMDKWEGLVKGLISNIDCLKAQLNGYQSINRHLE